MAYPLPPLPLYHNSSGYILRTHYVSAVLPKRRTPLTEGCRSIVTKPMHWVWRNTGVRFAAMVPEKLRLPAAATLAIAVILVGAFASPESQDNTRDNRAVSLFGLLVLIAAMWITSRDRKKIVWHTVIVGMLVQFIVALFVLRTKAGCKYRRVLTCNLC